MKRDNPLDIVFLDGTFEGNLVRDPLRPNRITLDCHFGLVEKCVVEHVAIYDRDHDFVRNNDLLLRSPGKGQAMRHAPVDRRVVHGNNRKIAFLITLTNVVVTRGGGEKQPLADRQVLVL